MERRIFKHVKNKWNDCSVFLIKLIVFFCVMLLFQGFASWVGTIVAGLFSYKNIDPYNIFASAFLHHIIQMLIPLAIIVFLKFKYKSDFGFRPGDTKTGIKYILALSVIMIIHSIIFYYILYAKNPKGIYFFPLNTLNVIGKLGFEYGITGPSEEILFRALPIGLFILLFKKSIPIKWGISLEVLIAAILFTLAHGNYILTLNYYFIIYTFILGLTFGVTYQKTGSIIYPVIMHSITNIIMTGTSFIFEVLYNKY